MTTLMDPTVDRVIPPAPPMQSESPEEKDPSALRRRVGVATMLLATAVLYLWNLSASGYANEFYAAAVQAGTKSWKAFLFGSSDWGNSITVDKPPASLWPMEIAGRIFGFNSWSMLAPQALMGVASVGLLYLTVKRWFGSAAGFIAGITLALTPIAVVMFRFNNPDAMMVLLITAGAYALTRAMDSHKHPVRWMILVGACLGFGFLTKSLQAFTVIPAFVVVYLVAARASGLRRVAHVGAMVASLLVSAGWWIAIVALWPASSRPYIGGSTNNSALELAFGYNGLGRITGDENGGAGASFSGSTGWGRLFNSEMGGQISWLLPAALIAILALAVISYHGPRTDRARAAAILWGGWLLVTGGILSFASGTIHSYYTVELAPAIAALVGIASVLLWRRRADLNARLILAIGTVVTGTWGYELLQRDSGWQSWVSWLIVIASIVAAICLVVRVKTLRHTALVGLVAAVIATGSGATAYALSAADTAHTGSTPAAGPSSTGSFGGRTGGGSAMGGGRPSGDGFGGGGFGGSTSSSSGSSSSQSSSSTQMGTAPSGTTSGSSQRGGFGGGGDSNNTALIALLKKAGTTWSAATVGSQTAATLQLDSDTDVMPIGGFTGSDNSPTLAQFEQWVKQGKIHYFIAGGQGGAGGGSGSASAITSWVESHFKTVTVGNTTVYDLTQASS